MRVSSWAGGPLDRTLPAMLTRLRVDGFKNLVDVDVRFGPYTCIAGANGVGKSNLFDAILFLSALAEKSLTEAALSVRSAGDLGGDPMGIFFEGGGTEARIRMIAEMILPPTAVDDLGQRAKASITFVEYEVELGLREPSVDRPVAEIMILSEWLRPIKLRDARSRLQFGHRPLWRKSVITGRRLSEFISTELVEGRVQIKRHQEGKGGPNASLAAQSLPRTVLSSATSSESPTALIARREMQSWRLLQLEPSHLREPDDYYVGNASLDARGRHLPTMLYRLDRADLPDEPGATLATLSNRLNELVRETHALSIDRDDARRLTTLYLHDRTGGRYPARALSDGTLRFLALLALDLDPDSSSLLCLEEPENGIHPERVSTILQVLEGMTVDVNEPSNEGNPLRQVIINTHSPLVVGATVADDLIVVELEARSIGGRVVKLPRFRADGDTWRAASGAETVSRSKIRKYIGSAPRPPRRTTSARTGLETLAEKYQGAFAFEV